MNGHWDFVSLDPAIHPAFLTARLHNIINKNRGKSRMISVHYLLSIVKLGMPGERVRVVSCLLVIVEGPMLEVFVLCLF